MFFARRRKGIFSLFLLATFVIFCSWLLQIKFNDENRDNQHLFIHQHDNINLKLELNHPHERALLLANTVTVVAEDLKDAASFKQNHFNTLKELEQNFVSDISSSN